MLHFSGVSGVILTGCLLAGTYTDLKRRRIPDGIIVVGGVLLVVAHLVFHPQKLWMYVLAALGVYLALAVVAIVTGGRIGGGDIKLFALLSLGLGWKATLWIVFVSHMMGGAAALILWLMRRVERGESLPFAPWIMVGYWMIVLWDQMG